MERRAVAADMHQAIPDRALLVAGAAGVLPRRMWIVGCQPGETEEFCTALSVPVVRAVAQAIGIIRTIVEQVNA
jgi:Ni,Fe-hydrogenase maturation factor